MQTFVVENFDHWRLIARQLILKNRRPEEVRFEERSRQSLLFDAQNHDDTFDQPSPADSIRVPGQFAQLARVVGFHRAAMRWNLLYRLLWRLKNGEPYLFELLTDEDVMQLNRMEKEVRRDAHKMKAFVRFRKFGVDDSGNEVFVAWHRPDHRIVRHVAPFFSRRFKGMNWTILTPDESVTWDQCRLRFGAGVPRSAAPDHDELEELWKTYYASTFNPARIKLKMMKSEMPVRYWSTMPETKLIDQLVKEAPQRVRSMVQKSEGYAETSASLIQRHGPASLEQLADLATRCTACDLHRQATQVVFGEGPLKASLVLLGEQPGDREDEAGRPFVGPAGQVLNEALGSANLDRDEVYLTNVVKHFKHQTTGSGRGKRRIHQRPNAREIRCCRPWFDAEWERLANPRVLVCLGNTAARTILGPEFRLTQSRGRVFRTGYGATLATWHPAAILRMPDMDQRHQRSQQLTDDLKLARSLVQDGAEGEGTG